MKYLRNALGGLYVVWIITVFFAGLFVVIPFIILSVWLLPNKNALYVNFIFIESWARFFFIFTGIYFTVKGRELIKADTPYIYVCNHNSYYDTVLFVIAVRHGVKVLGKVEITKVPFFGWIYKQVCVVIDRKSPESRVRSIARLKEQLAENISIFVFPEGTMNKTPDALQPFYDGAFRIAIETQTPILPLVIHGTRKCLPRVAPWTGGPGIVDGQFLSPVSVEGLTDADIPTLKQKVWDLMNEELRTKD